MGQIFFSYSREDKEIVERLVHKLEKHGFPIWWDGAIPPGENFRSYIDQKLKEAPAICVVWSENSVQSRWVDDEADEGIKRGNLVPISIDGSEIPRGYRSVQAAQLQPNLPPERYDQEFEKLVERLKKVASTEYKAQPRPRLRRPSPFTHPMTRTQNVSMMIVFIGLIVGFSAYDLLTNPNNMASLWFRLMIFLPTFIAMTAGFYFARRTWLLWPMTVAMTWMAVALVILQVTRFDREGFGPGGMGTALNVALALVLSGSGMVHSYSSRAAALFGGVAVYVTLAYSMGARNVEFWFTGLIMNTLIALFLCLGFWLRDRRAR